MNIFKKKNNIEDIQIEVKPVDKSKKPVGIAPLKDQALIAREVFEDTSKKGKRKKKVSESLSTLPFSTNVSKNQKLVKKDQKKKRKEQGLENGEGAPALLSGRIKRLTSSSRRKSGNLSKKKSNRIGRTLGSGRKSAKKLLNFDKKNELLKPSSETPRKTVGVKDESPPIEKKSSNKSLSTKKSVGRMNSQKVQESTSGTFFGFQHKNKQDVDSKSSKMGSAREKKKINLKATKTPHEEGERKPVPDESKSERSHRGRSLSNKSMGREKSFSQLVSGRSNRPVVRKKSGRGSGRSTMSGNMSGNLAKFMNFSHKSAGYNKVDAEDLEMDSPAPFLTTTRAPVTSLEPPRRSVETKTQSREVSRKLKKKKSRKGLTEPAEVDEFAWQSNTNLSRLSKHTQETAEPKQPKYKLMPLLGKKKPKAEEIEESEQEFDCMKKRAIRRNTLS